MKILKKSLGEKSLGQKNPKHKSPNDKIVLKIKKSLGQVLGHKSPLDKKIPRTKI